MEDDEDDLKLVQASAGLLTNLQDALPKLLWKPSKSGSGHGKVHRRVKKRDLDYVITLIDPFQGDPQLLDTKLKYILPPIVEAYLEYISQPTTARCLEYLSIETVVCTILYTLCKVRGYRVILGFLNNEPRYLEPVLDRLVATTKLEDDQNPEWRVQYILLLWLSHLMLTPFDLASISPARQPGDTQTLPLLVERVQEIGVKLLSSPTKAQDAAATLLVRLVTRPDMLKLGICSSLSAQLSKDLAPKLSPDSTSNIYEVLGPLRYFAGITLASADDRLGVSQLYEHCWGLAQDTNSRLADNAVAKKLFVKVFRNTAITALRAASQSSKWTTMLESSSLIEDVIDYLLRSLSDRDTPVRYAAAKALSRLVLDLEPTMGHEIIQAVLDMFKEDMPRNSETLDFRAVNALKWHGLTLTLAHMLFKRSAAPGQLHDIINALVAALQFEQRTATGSSMGTNVRDAANFGLWSLSRRYTTEELLSVNTTHLKTTLPAVETQTVIQALATNLVLSSCLDPVGNIRRGSSAALQELVGRHPNKVAEGIALVQIVDYQAVGLRRRAMVDVASKAAGLAEAPNEYWSSLLGGLLGWRAVGSPDVPSREAAAAGLAALGNSCSERKAKSTNTLLHRVVSRLVAQQEIEELHGLTLTLTYLLDVENEYWTDTSTYNDNNRVDNPALTTTSIQSTLDVLVAATKTFTSRVIRSMLPSAIAKLLAALSMYLTTSAWATLKVPIAVTTDKLLDSIDVLTERLLARPESAVQDAVPSLATALLRLKRRFHAPLGCIGSKALSERVAIDSSKGTLTGACGAIALGALAALYRPSLRGQAIATVSTTLANLTVAMNVDWRVIGMKAIRLAIGPLQPLHVFDVDIVVSLMQAVHRGLNDYTIDERGDVGSLVRLQAIACAFCAFSKAQLVQQTELHNTLQADVCRLGLEKLDRVRLEAARCYSDHLDIKSTTEDAASVSSEDYFLQQLSPLTCEGPPWKPRAILEGCISCCGTSSGSLLQASRSALVKVLNAASDQQLAEILITFADILKSLVADSSNNVYPALELLAFLLAMQIPQRLASSDFKWRNLLSTAQKSHHKSNDIPKILAAIAVYRGLSEVLVVRQEAVKKLVSMLKTNPYPKVRFCVAEALFVVTRDKRLKGCGWMKPPSANKDVVKVLEEKWVAG